MLTSKKDYSQVTEIPGARVTKEQLLRTYQRYWFASQYCQGQDVLEVACGGGSGLGLLAEVARSVTAVDCEVKNLVHAKRVYQDEPKIRIQEGDAQALPLKDKSFDVIILYEAIYYLPEPNNFFLECRRLLRPGGNLLIASANREWADFNPSAYSTRYFSAGELHQLLEKYGFQTDFFCGFPVQDSSLTAKILSLIKRIAVRLHLIPKSMKYKKILKRLFVGKLAVLPPRLSSGMFEYIPPLPLRLEDPNRQFKVIYAVGRHNGSH